MKLNRYILACCGLLVFSLVILFVWQGWLNGPLQLNSDSQTKASQLETSLEMISQDNRLESAGLLSRMRDGPDKRTDFTKADITLTPAAKPSMTAAPSAAAASTLTTTPSLTVSATPTNVPEPSTEKTTTTTSAPAPDPAPTKPAVKAAPTATPTPKLTPKPTPSPTPVPQTETTEKPEVDWQNQSHAQWLSEVFRLTNEVRKNSGVAILNKPDAALVGAAAVRAEECAVLFSHTRPDEEESSCFSVLDEFSITRSYAGENLLAGTSGYLTPESVIAALMESDGHRKNILNSDFTTVGIGFYSSGGKDYLVQLFIG